MARYHKRKNSNKSSRQGTSARVKAEVSLPTAQTQIVQGPVRLDQQTPAEAIVEFATNLHRKYLGTGLVGYGPYLEVLTTRNANELICQHGYALLRKMATDSEVDACLDALVQPSSSQPMVVDNAIKEDEPDHALGQEITDFVNFALERFPIDQWRRQQLRYMLIFGNAVSEIDWDVLGSDAGQWQDHMVISNLRLQEPEQYGFLVDRYGKIYGIAPLEDNLFTMANMVPLSDHHINLLPNAVPRWKVSVWTWDQKGTDPRGTSTLIPAYIPWWSKQRALEEWSCWLGRYAQPSIWATPGPDAVPVCITDPNTGQQTVTEPTTALLNALLQFRSASVLALPYGSQVNLLDANGSVEPFLKSIEMFDEKITRSLLGQHLATNGGDSTSRSAADLHALILRQYVASLRMYMTRQIQREIINPMVLANYGPESYRFIPKVNLGDTDGFAITITEVAVLLQSGYFSEDQLPKIDKLIGVPVRTSSRRVGAGNLPPYIPTPEELKILQALKESSSNGQNTTEPGTNLEPGRSSQGRPINT